MPFLSFIDEKSFILFPSSLILESSFKFLSEEISEILLFDKYKLESLVNDFKGSTFEIKLSLKFK